MSRSRRPVVPTRHTVTIDALAFGGAGVARVENKVAFVPGALPGETVVIEVVGRRRKFDRTKLIEVLTPSPDRRPPLCPHVSLCGGCSLQELVYEKQLEAKAQHVRDCLSRIGGLEVPEFGRPVPSPREVRYRNKMEFTFQPRPWEEDGPPEVPSPGPALGLHVPGRFDAVFDLEECVLPSPRAVHVLKEVRDFAREHSLPAYRSRWDEGLLRHLVVREGHHTGELLVALVVREPEHVLLGLGPRLGERIPGLTGVVLIVNRTKAAIAKGDQEEVLWGRPFFREKLAGLEFELGAQSFFQTNTAGAERLVEVLRESLDRTLDEVGATSSSEGSSSEDSSSAGTSVEGAPGRRHGHLLDLYCGAGTLGLCLADRFDKVTGVEQVTEAVQSAERTAKRNGIEHVSFHVDDVERWVREGGPDQDPASPKRGIPGPFDVLVVDPPRAGLHPKALETLPWLGAEVIAYVSCNPSTLARDAAGLASAGYSPVGLRIVDLFPQTGHIESILTFRRNVP
ncbi:MAG: class I SAM-dependent RNA methyltransferase [Candidatus Eisenbacteria bacterium]